MNQAEYENSVRDDVRREVAAYCNSVATFRRGRAPGLRVVVVVRVKRDLLLIDRDELRRYVEKSLHHEIGATLQRLTIVPDDSLAENRWSVTVLPPASPVMSTPDPTLHSPRRIGPRGTSAVLLLHAGDVELLRFPLVASEMWLPLGRQVQDRFRGVVAEVKLTNRVPKGVWLMLCWPGDALSARRTDECPDYVIKVDGSALAPDDVTVMATAGTVEFSDAHSRSTTLRYEIHREAR